MRVDPGPLSYMYFRDLLFANFVFYSSQHSLFAEFNTLAVMYSQPSSDFIMQEPPYILVNNSMPTRQGYTHKLFRVKKTCQSIGLLFSVQLLTWSRCLFMEAPLAVLLWPTKMPTNL